MTDDLLRRLEAADPLRTAALPPLADDARAALLERATDGSPTPGRRSPRFRIGVAVLAGAGALAVALSVATAGHRPAVLDLSAPSGGAGGACAPLGADTVGFLRHADVAFAGVVTDVQGEYSGRFSDGRVTIRPTRFYRGGPADEIELRQPPLEGSFPIDVGERLLVAADHGAVMGCVLSGPDTPELARYYRAAFG